VTPADRLLGAALATAVMAGIAWTSNAPMTAHGSADAVLRLAWSALPERVETCREQTVEELARLPRHMRQPLVCEGRAASYRLTVRADDTVIVDHVVRAGGMRHDRRLYVLRDISVPPVETGLEVRFDRMDASSTAPAGDGAALPRAGGTPPRQQGDTVPAHLAYAERLRFTPRRVVLITYDAQQRALIAVRDSPRD
jgi:hypothetical protein